MSVTVVVQFGLAMIPWCHLTSAALISGITSGTLSSMRNALELSTTTHPAFAATGANSFEMLPPALNRAMSMPGNTYFVSSLTMWSSPRNFSFLPTDRADASNVNSPTGKLRFSSVLIISIPTAPVAPTTATWGLRFIQRAQNIRKESASVKQLRQQLLQCLDESAVPEHPDARFNNPKLL